MAKEIKNIKTNEDYEQAIKRIEVIFDAQPDSPEFDELQLLVKLVESYEEEHFPIEKPDAMSTLKFRMEQQGLI